MGRRSLRESRDPESMLPAPLGVALLVVGSVLLTLGLVRGDDWGWTSARDRGIDRSAASPCSCVFVAHQARTSAPAMDLVAVRVAQLPLGERGDDRVRDRVQRDVPVEHPVPDLGLELVDPRGRIRRRAGPAARGRARTAVRQARGAHRTAAAGRRRWSRLRGRRAWRLVTFDAEPAFLTAYLPSMLLTGTGVALMHPAAVERDRPVVAAEPVRRRRRGQPGVASTRRHAGRRGRGRVRVGGDRASTMRWPGSIGSGG